MTEFDRLLEQEAKALGLSPSTVNKEFVIKHLEKDFKKLKDPKKNIKTKRGSQHEINNRGLRRNK